MVWEGVPWMVDGADHSAEVGRLLAYVGTGGVEGVASPGDCKVVASAIPDGNVHVNSGGLICLNRFPGGGQQSYVLRNEGDAVVALDAQGSSGVRHDLVAVIVEDPQYVGQPAPPDVATGPYVRLAVYKNVGSEVRTLAEVDPDQSGYALARVKFDASDGTITNADITDLRALANPHSTRRIYVADIAPMYALNTPNYITWPGAIEVVPIPEWATKAILIVNIPSTVIIGGAGGVTGDLRACIGYDLLGPELSYDYDTGPGAVERDFQTVFAEFEVPEHFRGTNQGIYVSGRRSSGAGYMTSWQWGLNVLFDLTFSEETV